jgi:predicted acyltransferase
MPDQTAIQPRGSQRLLSLDALRGFDMFWIIGGGAVFGAIAKIWPNAVTQTIDQQLQHVMWEGFHFEDLIFPLFMFIMGVVLPYSFERRRQEGQSRATIFLHIFKRGVILIALGLIYEGVLKFDWPAMRWSAVLTLIGGSYLIAAAIILYTPLRVQIVLFIAILLGYWAALTLIRVEDVQHGLGAIYGGGDYSMQYSLIAYLDQKLIPGRHPYGNSTNGVGPFLSLTGAASVMLGGFAGYWLRSARGQNRKTLGLILGGILCLAFGCLWGQSFPIIKLIWTSSYVLVAGGLSLLLLALFYYLIDVGKFTRWTFFFAVIGVNPITIYFLQQIVDFNSAAVWLFSGLAKSAGSLEPLIAALGVLALKWGFLYFLYRKKIFIKF